MIFGLLHEYFTYNHCFYENFNRKINRVNNHQVFFKSVKTQPSGKGFFVKLDERYVHTPSGNKLQLPTKILAEAIAEEWLKQDKKIDPSSMPMMQLSCTAIDRVHENRTDLIDETVSYGETDLLCYRADKPLELVKLQLSCWQPVLDWLADDLGIKLKVASGIVHIEQEKASIIKLREVISAYLPFPLTALIRFSQSFSSLGLGLAVTSHHITWQQASELAFLDEKFQAQRWGEDSEAVEREKNIRIEVEQTAHFMSLCGI